VVGEAWGSGEARVKTQRRKDGSWGRQYKSDKEQRENDKERNRGKEASKKKLEKSSHGVVMRKKRSRLEDSCYGVRIKG